MQNRHCVPPTVPHSSHARENAFNVSAGNTSRSCRLPAIPVPVWVGRFGSVCVQCLDRCRALKEGCGASSPRLGARVRRKADPLGYVEREPSLINSTFRHFIAFHHIPHRTIHQRVHGLNVWKLFATNSSMHDLSKAVLDIFISTSRVSAPFLTLSIIAWY